MDHIPTNMVSTVPPLYVVPVLSEANTLPTQRLKVYIPLEKNCLLTKVHSGLLVSKQLF